MAERRLGLIMHGVTGRMGYNQHLVRSILAIRDQGGITLANGDRLVLDPIIVGRDREKIQALADEARHQPLDHRSRRGARQPRGRRCSSMPARRRCGPRCSAGRSTPASTSIARSRCRTTWTAPSRWRGRRSRPASSTAWCRTSCSCPGLLKLKLLRDSGFFGRILSVRGEFGYWVFEGDWQPAQRPSWNYRKADGGGIILDMLCHWRYVLDNLFGEVKAVSCLGATHIPERVDEKGNRYTADADDAAYATFQLEGGIVAHINSSWDVRVRRDDLVTFQVDGTHGSAVAGLHKCFTQHRVNTPKPVWNPDQPSDHQLLRAVGRSARQLAGAERLQGAVGDVPPPRRRRRPLALRPRSRRQGRAARRARPAVLEGTPLARRSGAGDLR